MGKLHIPTCNLTESSYTLLSITWLRTDSSTDCSCTHIYCKEFLSSKVDVAYFIAKYACKCSESLPQCHRNRILELSTSHLQDVLELNCLSLERLDEKFVVLKELLVSCIKTEMNGCRICVVCRLRTVDMVIR